MLQLFFSCHRAWVRPHSACQSGLLPEFCLEPSLLADPDILEVPTSSCIASIRDCSFTQILTVSRILLDQPSLASFISFQRGASRDSWSYCFNPSIFFSRSFSFLPPSECNKYKLPVLILKAFCGLSSYWWDAYSQTQLAKEIISAIWNMHAFDKLHGNICKITSLFSLKLFSMNSLLSWHLNPLPRNMTIPKTLLACYLCWTVLINTALTRSFVLLISLRMVTSVAWGMSLTLHLYSN